MKNFRKDLICCLLNPKLNNNSIRSILNIKDLPNDLKIKFALYCAEDVFKYIKKDTNLYNKTRKCLDLVGSYIIDKNSVSSNQLKTAAYAAANAANAAAYAAAYAANAAYAAANAANDADAAYAAYAAANAANAADAAYAAYAAANAADAIARNKYLSELIKMVNEV